MRKIIPALLGLFFLFSCPNISNAQDFGLFHSLLDQLNEQQRKEFFNHLHTRDTNDFNLDGLEGSGVVDSLTKLIGGMNPIDTIADFSFQWGAGRDYLSNLIDSTNNDTLDISNLLEEYDIINGSWNNNLDSLSGLFDDYQDSIDIINDLDVDNPPNQDFDSLYTYFSGDIDSLSPGGLGGERFNNILNQLFSRDLFSDLELAYGRRDAGVNFYRNPRNEMTDVHVIRVGSVPNFQNLWESRWHASGSFMNTESVTGTDGSVSVNQVFKPLVMDFDYVMMYNPGFSFGPLTFRYVSGLGMEAGMLAPSFANNSSVNARNRVGNTVGYGPQISTGFSLTQGKITTYAIASAAYGRVICRNTLDHDYSSTKFEAGVRYGKAINIRYSIGEQNWTADLDSNTGKRVNYTQQFTIGMILDSLFK